MKDLFLTNIPAFIATTGLIFYFLVMGIVFISRPVKSAEAFSISPTDNAGITEIRVYYGGISLALGGFLAYILFALENPMVSLVGGLFFATTVLVTRTIFLFLDKGWKSPYTKLAIPAEVFFVTVLWTCFFVSKAIY